MSISDSRKYIPPLELNLLNRFDLQEQAPL
jgi:hypothetical protein